MRGISRTVVAQDAAVTVNADQDLDAACAGRGHLWNRLEADYINGGQPRAAAMARVHQICGVCPLIDVCRAWVEAEGYSGLAADSAWIEGSPAKSLPDAA